MFRYVNIFIFNTLIEAFYLKGALQFKSAYASFNLITR